MVTAAKMVFKCDVFVFSARAAAEIPRFVQRMANQTVKAGDSVTLTAEAVGVPIPMMSWQKDNRMIESGDRYIITTNGSVSMLYIPCVQPDDGTWFQCCAVNIAGTASNRCKLTVIGKSSQYREPYIESSHTNAYTHKHAHTSVPR